VISVYYLAPDKTSPLIVWAINHATDQRHGPSWGRWLWDRLLNKLEVYKRTFIEFASHSATIVGVSLIEVFFVGLIRRALFAAHLEAVAKLVAVTPLLDEQLRQQELRPPIATIYAAAPAPQLAAAEQ
jgi:hypothetical protein